FDLKIEDAYLEEFKTEKKYDFIASFHVIEHVPNPNTFLAKCYELLKDGGKLMIECPAIDKIYGNTVDFFFWNVHINTFSKQTLSAFLVKNGFKLLNHYWHDNFINILCEKVENQNENYHSYFEDVDTVKNRVKNYKPSNNSMTEKVKKGLQKLQTEPEEVIGKINTVLQDKVGRKFQTSLLEDRKGGGESLMHIAHFTTSNAGDTLLPVILRDLFEQETPLKWKTQHAHKVVDSKSVNKINSTKGLLIGGGGLFLKDTNPNELSGWQWSCSMDALEKIKVPIALFAVGYNRFRGQSDFAPIFTKHVNRVAEKSVMIGLRNYGSIENVKKYLPEDLHEKLVFQPCMTTLSSFIYGEKALRTPETPPFIAVNCAFDRSNLRFGENIGKSLSNLALGLKKASKIVPIKYYSHTPKDEHFLPFLDSFEVHYELVKLYRKSPRFVLDAYKAPLIAIGMRGHAQLVPFGSHRPIISLISHNKLRYFLDDIDANEWGVEMQDENLAEVLAEKIQHILDNLSETENQVKTKQKVLWDITQNNVRTIKKTFNL
ncbi:MAG: methyltransferase domain-containing protein, partial [Bacteroidota bacterium]